MQGRVLLCREAPSLALPPEETVRFEVVFLPYNMPL